MLRKQPKILASVLPKLASPPMTASALSTLSALSLVAGAALPPHLTIIFPPLLDAMASADEGLVLAATDAATSVFESGSQ